MVESAAALAEVERLRAEMGVLRAEVGALRAQLARAGLHATGLRVGLERQRAESEELERRNDDLVDVNAELARISEALALSEARHRAILASATDYAIVATDLAGRITTWNEGARRIFGWGEAAILGESFDVVFAPEDRASGFPSRMLEEALDEGKATGERWFVRSDGSRFWASGTIMPLRVDGGLHGFLKILRDRTGEREAEQSRRRADERLQLALGVSALIGIWEWDLDADVVYADANFARIYGIDPEIAEHGASLEFFLERHHPDDMPRLRQSMATARLRGTRFSQQYRVLRPDGEIRWVLARGDIVHHEDRPVRFPGAIVDITENKRAELMQSALVELGDRFRDIAEPSEMAYAAAEIMGRALSLTRAGYGSVEASGEILAVERDWRAPGAGSVAGRHRFEDYGTFIEDLRRGATVVVDDVMADPRTAPESESFRQLDIRAMLNVPVIERGDLVAILFLHDRKVRHWSADKLAFIRDVAQRTRDAVERRRAEDRQRLLMRELQHRVKNTLAMVQAIASQTFGGPDNEAARHAFASRVVALGHASDVLTETGWSAADMHDLVRAAIVPYLSQPHRFHVSGPRLEIAAEAALAVTLALHELGTNAAKYGALSAETGRVVLNWAVDPGQTFRLSWLEEDGPTVAPPTRKGFGSRLLDRTLGNQFGGRVLTTYDPTGLRCVFTAPLAHIRARVGEEMAGGHAAAT